LVVERQRRRPAMSADYVLSKELPSVTYEDAVARVTTALAKEGFGVLTEIDVKATLKRKLDVDFKRYLILGACNPPLAFRALTAEPLIGALLPCNVIVMERDQGGSIVSAFKPSAGFQMVDNDAIHPIAAEVEARLQRVLDELDLEEG
jgi:uncharacterized protein (DUF302 family)